MLLHGTEGIGKSTMCKFAPKPIFIQTEDGLDQIDVAKFPLAKSYDAVKNNLMSLLEETHDFLTVVIDSLDWLEKLAVLKILGEFKSKKTLADFDYGKGYAMLIPLFEDILAILHRLREDKNMNIILVAHTKTEKVEDPTGASYDQYAPRLDKRVNGLVKEWCDIIGFASHYMRKEEQDENFGGKRTVAKSITEGGTDRQLILEGSPAIVAKCRYQMPGRSPLIGKEFFKNLWNAIPLAPLYSK